MGHIMGHIEARWDAFRAGIHIPLGVFVVWLSTTSWVLCLVFSLGVVAYEVLEEWRIKDQGYKDLYGYLVGIVAGSAVLALWGAGWLVGVMVASFAIAGLWALLRH